MLKNYQTIAVALDGSESSERALHKAIHVAKRNHAALLLVHIIDTRAFQTVATFDETMADHAAKAARQTLTSYQEEAHAAGVSDVRLLVEYGQPKTMVAKTLPEREKIDLILIGATGLNAVERILIGSVSDYVIRHAHCDVLVVRTTLDNQLPAN